MNCSNELLHWKVIHCHVAYHSAHLDSIQLQAVQGLVDCAVLRKGTERVRFAHDLLGDWARLRVLIGQTPTASPDDLKRCSDIRWHRAVRLYGRWLLGQANGVDRWTQAMRHCDDGTNEGVVVRDLLLEAVILNENSQYLLEQVWPVLLQDGASLLKRVLDRFLFVATIPDPRLQVFAGDTQITAQMNAAFRIPFWPYWGAMVSTLHKHGQEILTAAPVDAAKICRMWLDTIPPEIRPGTPFPWRREAAELSLTIAREMQARQAEGHYWAKEEDRIAYEAALLAAPECPDEVSALALELARRRPLSSAIQERADKAKRAAEEAMRQRDSESRQQLEKLRKQRPQIFRGPLRKAWPDGPSDRVCESFRNAVLGSQGILSLAAIRPDVALEVLLAVCIEAPSYQDTHGGSDLIDHFGIHPWQEAYPPMYFRGPFLSFLRQSPVQAIEFSIRLVNFATVRWIEGERRHARRWSRDLPTDEELSVTMHGPTGERRWVGDSRVYRWYLDWPVDAHVLTCVLMALEKWIYERIDAGEEISTWLREIMERSESVAFAGLLVDVGKKHPQFFTHELRPLLGTWILHFWDRQIAAERSGPSIGMMGWLRDPQELVELAREWHTARHRLYDLPWIASWLLINGADMRLFFADTVERWRHDLSDDGKPRNLQLLIEQLTPDNYRKTPIEEGKIRYDFVLSAQLEETTQRDQQVCNEGMRLLTFPMTCRQILDGKSPVEDLQTLWDMLQSIAQQDVSDPDSPHRKQDAVSGGIAVLICKCREWLRSDAHRESWCFDRLRELVLSPPPRGDI